MQFTDKELAMCNYVLRVTENIDARNGLPISRVLPIDDMATGISVNKKIKVTIVDDKFVDADVEFDTEEKAMLLKFLNRSYNVDDAEVYLELKKKLA